MNVTGAKMSYHRPMAPSQTCSFKLDMQQKPFSSGVPPRTPLGELTKLRRSPKSLRDGTPSPYPLITLSLDDFGVSILRPPNKILGYAYPCPCLPWSPLWARHPGRSYQILENTPRSSSDAIQQTSFQQCCTGRRLPCVRCAATSKLLLVV